MLNQASGVLPGTMYPEVVHRVPTLVYEGHHETPHALHDCVIIQQFVYDFVHTAMVHACVTPPLPSLPLPPPHLLHLTMTPDVLHHVLRLVGVSVKEPWMLVPGSSLLAVAQHQPDQKYSTRVFY